MLSLAICAFLVQSQASLPPLGTNLAGFSDGTTQWPLIDVFKLSSPWVAYNEADSNKVFVPPDVDSDGNVKSLKPGQVVETTIFSNGKNPVGTFILTWKGKGEFAGSQGSEIQNATEGRAELVVKDTTGIHLMLKSVNPTDPPHDIKLQVQDYAQETSPFHPIFLQRMSLYRALRFMDWGGTNNSPLKDWSDRPQLNQQRYTGPKGVPMELMVDLANSKLSIPWFCVPHQATDDYVEKMAEFLKNSLKPDLQVAIEYSNECWNPAFSQKAWCEAQGKAAKLSGDATEAGNRYYSKRSAEIFEIFSKVFGGSSRLIRVLSGPANDTKTMESILTWQNTYRKADVMAVAPYFGEQIGELSPKAATVDDIFEKMDAEIKGPWRDNMFALGGLASKYRLKLVSYAGGQSLIASGANRDDSDLNKLFDLANTDTRMTDSYSAALKTWRAVGGTLFMHYLDCAPMTKTGRWGAIEFQNQDTLTAKKHRGLLQYALFPDH